jgi:hypothetical protein
MYCNLSPEMIPETTSTEEPPMNTNRLGVGVLFVAISLISGATAAMADKHDHDKKASKAILAEHYLAIQEALAGDSLERVPEHAAALQELAAAMEDRPRKGEHPANAAGLAR